jgi:hypothetical protein
MEIGYLDRDSTRDSDRYRDREFTQSGVCKRRLRKGTPNRQFYIPDAPHPTEAPCFNKSSTTASRPCCAAAWSGEHPVAAVPTSSVAPAVSSAPRTGTDPRKAANLGAHQSTDTNTAQTLARGTCHAEKVVQKARRFDERDSCDFQGSNFLLGKNCTNLETVITTRSKTARSISTRLPHPNTILCRHDSRFEYTSGP